MYVHRVCVRCVLVEAGERAQGGAGMVYKQGYIIIYIYIYVCVCVVWCHAQFHIYVMCPISVYSCGQPYLHAVQRCQDSMAVSWMCRKCVYQQTDLQNRLNQDEPMVCCSPLLGRPAFSFLRKAVQELCVLCYCRYQTEILDYIPTAGICY